MMNLIEYCSESQPKNLPSEMGPAPSVQALVFDWGNTLMPVFSEYDGPMADWPRVEAMPGVVEALAQLKGRYQLALATNASDSTPAQIRTALHRVGLDGFFAHIFTGSDLGARKLEPVYFERAAARMGVSLEQTVMIGDSPQDDVLGAARAGMRTIWVNLAGRPFPEAWPEQDGEIQHFEDLPSTIEGLDGSQVSIETCHRWMMEEEAAARLLAHTVCVSRAAYTLAVWLRKAGQTVDPILAHRGGLLHDLDKFSSRKTGEAHGVRAARLLESWGQPNLAEIARRHLINGDECDLPRTWEEKVVFYADKLAEGSQLVRFETRLAALKLRYPDYVDKMEKGAPFVRALEKEIAEIIGFTPDEVLPRLMEIIPV